MRPTLNELMEQIGIQVWPERWKDIYDTVMGDFEKKGCSMADPARIEALTSRYDILKEQRELYKKAAWEVAKQESLGRLLALLCATLADPEHRDDDLEHFSAAYETGEHPNIGLNMLTGLALLSQMPECYHTLSALGLPEEEIIRTMRIPEAAVGLFRQTHNGIPGFHRLHWYQRLIKGHLFRIGRLEIELYTGFRGRAQIFRSRSGEIISLGHERRVHASGIALGSAKAESLEGAWEANVEETDVCWIGFPYNAKGLVAHQKVYLPKGEWEKVLSRNDPVVALHIPADGRLDPVAVTRSVERIGAFLQTYFPEYPYAAFTCNSWLINPEVVSLLGPDSNISKFAARFHPLTHKTPGTSVFSFVFHKSAPVVLEELPENTRLEKALKAYYLSGKVLHEMYGYFLKSFPVMV